MPAKFKNFINFRFSCNVNDREVNTSSLLLGTFSNLTPACASCVVAEGSASPCVVAGSRIAIYSRALKSRYVLRRVFARHLTRAEEQYKRPGDRESA